MTSKQVKECLDFLSENLKGLPVNRVFNSIGSNIFIEFGKDIERIMLNGKKRKVKEWCIWISHSSWRISKHNAYVVGSDDDRELIIPSIQNLLGKKFISININSKCFEVTFNFENGYQLSTFFNKMDEDQWYAFLPNDKTIQIDCSNFASIKKLETLSESYTFSENYRNLNLPLDVKVIDIYYNKYNLCEIKFEKDILIDMETFGWRLEKNGEYYVGCLDEVDDENNNKLREKLSELIGKKFLQAELNSMMDAKFFFTDQYVLKLFTCRRIFNPWEIFQNGRIIFGANVELFKPNIENIDF